MADKPLQLDLFSSVGRPATPEPGRPEPARRNAIVEAGAGTGKTTDIVCGVLERLLEEPELDPAAIVLITFTEKAAAEIADRVRFALASLHRSFEDAAPAWRNRDGNVIFDVPSDKHAAWRDACARQIARLDRLRSQTIHSFCQSILKRFPLEATLDPQFAIIEGFERSRLIDEIYTRWIEHETSSVAPGEWTAEWSLVFDDLGGLSRIRESIVGAMLDRRDMIADPRYSLGDLDAVAEHIQAQIALLREVDDFTLSQIEDDAARTFASWLRTHDLAEPLTLENLIAYFEPIESVMNEANLQKGKRTVNAPLVQLRNKSKWRSSTRPNGTILEVLRQHRVAAALRAMATRFYAFLDEEKRRLGVLDFDDLLIRTESLLRDDRILDAVRQHYRYIFVDEFQDTDRVQAEIVLRLARDADGAFIPGRTVLVGDPKQAIYSFRRADPEMYASTVRQFIEGGAERRWLDRQYRSDPSLVTELNELFSRVFGETGDESPAGGLARQNEIVFQPQYKRLEAARSAMQPELPARLRFLQAPRGDAPTDDVAQARAIAAWIEAERGDSGYRQFAILLRRLTNVQHYVDTLERAGIPVVLPPLRSPFDHPAVVDLLTVLRAIAFPFDRGAELSAARSPWLGLGDDEIAIHQFDIEHEQPCGWDRYVETIQRWRRDAERMNVADTIELLLEETSMEVAWGCLHGGDRALAQISRVRQLATSWDRSDGGSLRQFVAELGRRRAVGADVEPPQVDDEIDAVRILTVHTAKGLEFDTVILPDLCPVSPTDNLRVSAIDQVSSLVFTGIVTSLSALFTRVDGLPLGEIIKEREEKENERLFYVAVTRAKSDVVFVCQDEMQRRGFFKPLAAALGLGKGSEILEHFPPDDNDSRIETFPRDGGSVTAAFHRSTAITTSAERNRLATDNVARIVDTAPTEVSTEEVDLPPETRPDRGELKRLRAGSKNRAPGILVHRVLEVWDGDPSKLETTIESIAREQGADAATVDRATAQLMRLLSSPALARLSAATTLGRELTVWAPDDDGAVHEMRIDRLIEENGRLAVVDYKTGKAEETRVERDREQVRRYCDAIQSTTDSPCAGLLWYIDEDRDELVEV